MHVPRKRCAHHFDGYTAVYTEGKDEAQEKDVTLPELSVGEMLAAQNLTKNRNLRSRRRVTRRLRS